MRTRNVFVGVMGLLQGLSLASCEQKMIQGPQGPQGEQGEQGEQGDAGISIVSVELTSSDGLKDTYTITFSDGSTTTFVITNGEDGDKGETGDYGLSAYEIYLKYNPDYTGTEEDWIHDLISGALLDNETCTITFDPNGGSLNEGDETMRVVTKHAIGDMPVPEKDGKTFLGWYTGWTVNDVQVTSNTPIYSDLELVAMWDSYDVDFIDWDGSVFESISVAPGEQASEPDKIPTRPTDDNYSYIFTEWDFDFSQVINSDVTISSKWVTTDPTYTMEFGSYPQSVVSDSDVKALLSELDGAEVEGTILEYDADEDGEVERYLVKNNWSGPMRADDGARIDTGINYFKSEPIVWRIMAETSDSYYMLADRILDANRIGGYSWVYEDPDTYEQYWIVNDYSLSEIRKWLNDGFLATAFSSVEQSRLLSTHLEGNALGDYGYLYDDCDDRVYLPSYDDLCEYPFTDDVWRIASTTDYARINSGYAELVDGWSTNLETYGDGSWWLRTADASSLGDYDSFGVHYEGYIYTWWSNSDERGVRPMIQIAKTESNV